MSWISCYKTPKVCNLHRGKETTHNTLLAKGCFLRALGGAGLRLRHAEANRLPAFCLCKTDKGKSEQTRWWWWWWPAPKWPLKWQWKPFARVRCSRMTPSSMLPGAAHPQRVTSGPAACRDNGYWEGGRKGTVLEWLAGVRWCWSFYFILFHFPIVFDEGACETSRGWQTRNGLGKAMPSGARGDRTECPHYTIGIGSDNDGTICSVALLEWAMRATIM